MHTFMGVCACVRVCVCARARVRVGTRRHSSPRAHRKMNKRTSTWLRGRLLGSPDIPSLNVYFDLRPPSARAHTHKHTHAHMRVKALAIVNEGMIKCTNKSSIDIRIPTPDSRKIPAAILSSSSWLHGKPKP